MKWRRSPSHSHDSSGDEGLCRACVLRLPVDARRKVLRDMFPPIGKRYQLDRLPDR